MFKVSQWWNGDAVTRAQVFVSLFRASPLAPSSPPIHPTTHLQWSLPSAWALWLWRPWQSCRWLGQGRSQQWWRWWRGKAWQVWCLTRSPATGQHRALWVIDFYLESHLFPEKERPRWESFLKGLRRKAPPAASMHTWGKYDTIFPEVMSPAHLLLPQAWSMYSYVIPPFPQPYTSISYRLWQPFPQVAPCHLPFIADAFSQAQTSSLQIWISASASEVILLPLTSFLSNPSYVLAMHLSKTSFPSRYSWAWHPSDLHC